MTALDRFLLLERLKNWRIGGGVVRIAAAFVIHPWARQNNANWMVEEIFGTLHQSRHQHDVGSHKAVLNIQPQNGQESARTTHNDPIREIRSQIQLMGHGTPDGLATFKLAD